MNAPLIDIQNVSLSVTRSKIPILDEITYQIYHEDFIIILGSNGSGKSSLLKIVERIYQPTRGTLYLEGKELRKYNSKQLLHSIKTLTQNYNESLFTSLTVEENCRLIVKKYNENSFKEYLAQFNVNLPTKMNQIVNVLSGGEKQALALALTMVEPPKILLLDEHTSALDPKSSDDLMLLTQKIVRQYKITCILTTHDLNLAKDYGNRILALKGGRIYQKIDQIKPDRLTSQDLLLNCY